MKKIVLLLIFCVLVSSCKKDLVFGNLNLKQKTTMPCKEVCSNILINIPIAEGKSVVADSINMQMLKLVQNNILINDKLQKLTDFNSLMQVFISDYENIRKQNPNDIFGWEAKIDGKIVKQTDKLLNIEMSIYVDTAGAHGLKSLHSVIADTESGKKIDNKKLFLDEDKFKVFAEKAFRKKFKLADNQSMDEAGFIFDEDKFELPENYFFTKEGLLLHYNPYEITTYAQGAQQLLLKYKDVKPFLAIDIN